jgi:hypothetical protein
VPSYFAREDILAKQFVQNIYEGDQNGQAKTAKTVGLCLAFNSGQEHSRRGLVPMIFLNIECRTRNNEYPRKNYFVAGLTENEYNVWVRLYIGGPIVIWTQIDIVEKEQVGLRTLLLHI